MKKIILIAFALLMNSEFLYSQVDPVKIIDTVAGTLLPKIVQGVKDIKEANTRTKKNIEADSLEKVYKKEQALAVENAKRQIIEKLGKDIEYLSAINSIQLKIERISNDVGRLSIFKDANLIDVLIAQEAVIVKNEVVRKFFNAFEQVKANEVSLRTLRDGINTTSVPAAGRSSVYIGQIIAKIEEVESSVNDCPAITETTDDETQINSCLRTIKSVSNDIASLETQVESLNTEIAAMTNAYLTGYKQIRDAHIN
ncbi:MAG: hypothetical protein AAF600_04630 [Bacteroidota bacterium]